MTTIRSILPGALAAVLALGTFPAAALAVPVAGAAAAVRDTLVDVGGHRLHVEITRGEAPLAIVFEAGGGADHTAWSAVPDSVAARTGATVVAYDRAGLGSSDLGPDDLTPAMEVEDLAGALDALGVPSRRILVGHSYGGMLALLHASLRPEEVVGLVLVDPMNPRFVEATGDFVKSTVPSIEEPENDRERAILRMTRCFDALAAAVAPAEAGLEVPIVVVTAGEPWWGEPGIDRAWRESHEAIAAAGGNRRLVVAEGSDHDVPGERPEAVVGAVEAVIEATGAR